MDSLLKIVNDLVGFSGSDFAMQSGALRALIVRAKRVLESLNRSLNVAEYMTIDPKSKVAVSVSRGDQHIKDTAHVELVGAEDDAAMSVILPGDESHVVLFNPATEEKLKVRNVVISYAEIDGKPVASPDADG